MATRSFTVTIQDPDLSGDEYARAALALWYALEMSGLGDRAVVHLDAVGNDGDVHRVYDRSADRCPWGP